MADVSVADLETLLRRFAPRLRYDAQETYFADHPAQVTVMPGVALRAEDGTVLARSDDGSLSLERLATEAPGEGQRLSIEGRDYRQRYARIRQDRPELRNHLLARAVRDREGALWLQYWAWYLYNDYRLAANVGLHEGDWELVQLRLDGEDPETSRPVEAVYAQHAHAERRAWDRVQRDGDAPVVFVARGSHAAYFEPGVFATDAWIDIADGRRPSPRSTLLIVLGDEQAWTRWRGTWGDTTARIDGVETPSPEAPCRRPHWRDPLLLADTATDRRLPRSPLPGPDFTVRRHDGRLAVDYDLRDLEHPAAVLVTLNSHGEPGVPPRTATFDVTSDHRSGVVTDLAVAADRTYEVHLSVVAHDGTPSAPVRRTLDRGDHDAHTGLTARIGLALAPLLELLPGGRGHGG